MTKNDERILSSAELHKDLNEERKNKGLKEMPAINPKGATTSYCQMDKSWESVPDFFKQMIRGRKE